MSLNIQTSTGLLEIGGSVTKEKIISALGYSPANEEVETTVENHIDDTDIHITSDERALWNKNVENLDSHKSDTTIHVTSAEKQTWNNKSDFSGFYADLPDAPSIQENNSGEVTYADENGNVIAKINADGFETTTVTAKNAVIGGVDIGTKLDEHKESIDGVSGDLATHISDADIHVTTDDKTLWNNKSDFSGDYNDLTNAPSIVEDSSGELVYADESGNVIVKISENGLETTQVTANTVVVNGTDVETKLTNLSSTISTHANNGNIHITADERTTWNNKSDFSGSYNDLTDIPTDLASTTYVDTAVANLVNSAPEALNTLDELAAALGDDANFANTVTTQIGLKASQESLDNHISDTTVHITATERTVWNNKSDFSGDYNDLTNAPNIYEDGSQSVIFADESGNIVMRVDGNGFETTSVVAQNVVVNNTDVEAALDSLSELVGTKTVQTQISEAITAENLSQYATDTDLTTHTSNTSNPHSVTKSQIGLGNVDNTADANKSVASAAKLTTARTITLSGDVSGSGSFDGSDNLTITTTVSDDSHNHTIDNIDNLQTTLDGKLSTSGTAAKATADASGNVITSTYETKSDATAKLDTAKSYADGLIADLDVSDTAVSGEYVTAVSETNGKISVSRTSLPDYSSTYAAKTHTHAISDVTNLQSTLDGKAASDHTHEEYLTSIPAEYITETELDAKGYLTAVPAEYVTETELTAKGYLTQHQDLSAYAKKTEVPAVIDNLTSTSTTAALSAAQGAALKTAIDSITGDIGELGGGDMMKATYDTNNNGIVDNAEKVNGFTVGVNVPADAKFTDTNTTYTFDTGDSNGQIKVTPSGGSAQNVSVKGLGSAAYTESTAYATAAQGTLADNAMPISGGMFTGSVGVPPDNAIGFLTEEAEDLTSATGIAIWGSTEIGFGISRYIDGAWVDDILKVNPSTGEVIGGKLMPKSDGTFTGVAKAYGTKRAIDYNGGELMNITVRDNGNTAAVSTQFLVMTRK